ncbi:flavodoxin reductase [Mycobacterium sp. CBMA 234]|uniref:FAD-binding oxidoreductase n=1 Tax=Mycolicibacterium sp. CBMA 234 TaxID=1918495 RepID=UPI0012DEE67E|nr:FAD-binding oxidoreductase [Mycolicibacterium sp. CBMA 234]MUL64597.1 flavodoxin reductase [Mycolicibacterium sp. CBMA 234]
MTHMLAPYFDRADEVVAEIANRAADTTDYWTATQALIDDHHPKRLRLNVTEVIEETPTTKTFRLQRPDGADLPPFLAGQYVAVESDGTTRAYAMASSPTEVTRWDLTVRRVPGGQISNRLIDELAPGDEIVTSGPQGTFHHNPLFHGDDVVFIAGGSGVVPAMSMIREIVANDIDRRFHLVYGSRDEADVIFRAELAQITATHDNITATHVIGGLITAAAIEDAVGALDGRMVYVCGPQALYPYALAQLTQLGHPRHRIRFEANGAPTSPQAQESWPAGVDPNSEVTVTVGDRSFRAPAGRPLLDSLEDQGIRPESACRSGECSLCRVRVLEGTVHQAEESKPRLCDAKFGYVHSCVAYPVADVTLEV